MPAIVLFFPQKLLFAGMARSYIQLGSFAPVVEKFFAFFVVVSMGLRAWQVPRAVASIFIFH